MKDPTSLFQSQYVWPRREAHILTDSEKLLPRIFICGISDWKHNYKICPDLAAVNYVCRHDELLAAFHDPVHLDVQAVSGWYCLSAWMVCEAALCGPAVAWIDFAV